MTPAARISAAIGILDTILSGTPAEQALTGWARRSRFAGSGDRAAVRDHVYQALRCRRSFAALGGGETGRGMMIGALRAAGAPLETLFGGTHHAPAPLTDAERAHLAAAPNLDAGTRLDCPDWLMPALRESLGADFAAIMAALRERAPVFLRANLLHTTREGAIAALGRDGITAEPHPLCETALEVTSNARRIRTGSAFAQGLVEPQDAASQAVIAALPDPGPGPVLDFCAGGGGKALALAARFDRPVHAHDANPARMRDLPSRAARAGARIEVTDGAALAGHEPFALVLVDAPCSGSGSWRRDPAGKWALTPARLDELTRLQAGILDAAAAHVAAGGFLAYATCSLLDAENSRQIDAFLDRGGWRELLRQSFTPLDGGDGFFLAILRRP